MLVITGGAGFIGSNIVRGLNERGITDLLVVDDLSDGNKCRNIQDCDFTDYMDKDAFLEKVKKNCTSLAGVKAIFHEGACSDTMESDGKYIMENNYDYTKVLLDYCQANQIQFIYASSASTYGNNSTFIESPEYEQALNAYAYSKLLFDRYLRKRWDSLSSQVVGLRYFNVYGRGESHKGRMASVAYHFFNQYRDQGYVNLFAGSGGYGDGEQLRDFVWVEDVVKVNLHFYDHPETSGIFNLGTGAAGSFNQVAAATLNAVTGDEKSISDWVNQGLIRYIEFPAALVGKYQSFTQADLNKLRQDGNYQDEFATVEQGVAAYIMQLQDQSVLT